MSDIRAQVTIYRLFGEESAIQRMIGNTFRSKKIGIANVFEILLFVPTVFSV